MEREGRGWEGEGEREGNKCVGVYAISSSLPQVVLEAAMIVHLDLQFLSSDEPIR